MFQEKIEEGRVVYPSDNQLKTKSLIYFRNVLEIRFSFEGH